MYHNSYNNLTLYDTLAVGSEVTDLRYGFGTVTHRANAVILASFTGDMVCCYDAHGRVRAHVRPMLYAGHLERLHVVSFEDELEKLQKCTNCAHFSPSTHPDARDAIRFAMCTKRNSYISTQIKSLSRGSCGAKYKNFKERAVTEVITPIHVLENLSLPENQDTLLKLYRPERWMQ